ncbi:MAG: [Fe-S]-binding protein [Planctomyces sp.]|nr:[Fe-S]-binding protein [Planctomyces sp.]
MSLPRMMRVRQNYSQPRIEDVHAAAFAELQSLNLDSTVKPGETVAITAGSRGIANISTITRAIVDYFKSIEAVPFIVPSMGSHGGGTAQGQVDLLGRYGISEQTMECEIRASMDTIIVAETAQGIPVHFDKHASKADHVFVAGRIKPHTAFVGEIESGLHKMMLIGLGKHHGAKIYHRAILEYSFPEIIAAVAELVLKKCRICGGLGIVENAFDETALLKGVLPADFKPTEIELLQKARELMPQLPVSTIDLLIIDEIGKDISGSGLDTNVVGRKFNDHVSTELDSVQCKRIFVRGLTKATHGNANGIGIAEFTNRRTLEGIDWEPTRINAITGGHPTAGMLPNVFETDEEAILASFQTIALKPVEKTEIVQIRNTLELRELLLSEAYYDLVKAHPNLELLSEPGPMQFDGDRMLKPV